MARTPRKQDKRRFYARALTAAERADLGEAFGVEGVAEEVAALRLRLRSAVRDHPEDMELMLRGMDVLRRMVVSKYGLSRGDGREVTGFAEETLRRIQARGEAGRGDDDT